MNWKDIIARLRSKGIKFAKGLSPEEITSAEEYYGIIFPYDYREFLSEALPVGKSFPNWRILSENLKNSIKWPWSGMAYDIEHDSYWHASWGMRPAELLMRFESPKSNLINYQSSFPYTDIATFLQSQEKPEILFSRSIRWISFITAQH